MKKSGHGFSKTKTKVVFPVISGYACVCMFAESATWRCEVHKHTSGAGHNIQVSVTRMFQVTFPGKFAAQTNFLQPDKPTYIISQDYIYTLDRSLLSSFSEST